MSQRNGPLPADMDMTDGGRNNSSSTVLHSRTPFIDNLQYPPNAATQNQAPEGESNFSDGSGPLFSMYLERAVEEDEKMVESWKGDAEGILVFVSARLLSCALLADTRVADWSFLCRCCVTAFGLHSEPPAGLSGHFSVLPREHSSATLQGKWIPD